MRLLRLPFVVVYAVSVAPVGLSAQFQVPLPPHLSDDIVRLSKTKSCAEFEVDALVIAARKELKAPDLRSGPQDPTHTNECPLHRDIFATRLKPVNDAAVSRLFGGSALAALDQLGGGFSGSQAYVASALVAGNAGDFRFNFTYLRASSKADSSTGDTASSAILRRASDRMTQLVMNGGEATARFIMPHRATGGINWQSSWGTYASFGVLGAVQEHAPVPVAISLVSEFQASLAIREADTYKRLGDIYVAVRPGGAFVFGRERIVEGERDRFMPFVQASIGVRTSDKLRYGVLYTLVPGHLNRYIPAFQVVAQTTLPAVKLKE